MLTCALQVSLAAELAPAARAVAARDARVQVCVHVAVYEGVSQGVCVPLCPLPGVARLRHAAQCMARDSVHKYTPASPIHAADPRRHAATATWQLLRQMCSAQRTRLPSASRWDRPCAVLCRACVDSPMWDKSS